MGSDIISLVSVAVLLLGSPGPAPLALAAIGATAGFRSALPFLLGILTALILVSLTAALSLSFILEISPLAKRVVQLLGAAYIVYLAYKIASGPVLEGGAIDSENTPNFIDGLFLNLLNPKAYAAFFALFSQFGLAAKTPLLSLFYTGVISLMVAVMVDVLWLMFGSAIGPLFRQPRSARVLRISLGVLMVIAVLSVFL